MTEPPWFPVAPKTLRIFDMSEECGRQGRTRLEVKMKLRCLNGARDGSQRLFIAGFDSYTSTPESDGITSLPDKVDGSLV